jgi:hypothetical protein
LLAGCADAGAGAARDAGNLDLPQPRDDGPDAGAHPSTLVVLPDTQFYACAYPEIFDEQARWVVAQRRAQGVELVLHTGDIVDTNVAAQWQVAAGALHALDGVVPYLITTGNHDVSRARDSLVADYFDPGDLATDDFQPMARDAPRLDNAFGVVQLGGQRWLVLGVEFGPRDAVVDWAAGVLEDHADLPAILFTHAYLYSDGRRYDRAIQPPQPYHPDSYQYTPEQGINDGQDLWRKLVEPHENVRLVLSGHVIPDGTAHTTDARASGTRVHQVLANYQRCDFCPCAEVEGGGGYLRLLRFTRDHIAVSTYSPHLDAWLRDAENEFDLPLE